MASRKILSTTEIIIFSVLFILIFIGLYIRYFVGIEAFLDYVREDGVVEYLTFAFLLACSIVCISRTVRYARLRKGLWIFTWALLAVMFFFAAGEEISWGQRIFGIHSSKFFLEHNKQAETNLHNIIVDGKNLNKLIFSKLMFIVLAVYFVFLKPLHARVPFIRNLVNKFGVPLPKWIHIIIFFAATLLILAISAIKESELHELSFGVIFLIIFLFPAETETEKPVP